MKVALISGGSKGLGAGLVDSFLERGIKVATFSRSATEKTEAWQKKYGENFYFEALSLGDKPACKQYIQNVQEKLGDINILINNAGVAHTAVLALSDDDAIDRVIDTNLKGTFYLTRLVCRPMLSLGWGRIINISSIVGLSGYRGLSIYSATKAGLDGFTRSLARELGARNITVNSVAPGYLTTEMTEEINEKQRAQIIGRTPMGRMGTAQDVAGAVQFLASEEADFITGQVLVVDGGIGA
ncbi:3-oxoacyl-[acyl-carrier-protein] reductase FabG [Halioglobus japonicus]|nr:3-oxoacyl-[acyl-carrier-protein] reductase FabG [Halioglobus japonicus]